MRNKRFFTVLSVFFLFVSFVSEAKLYGQTAKTVSYTIEPILTNVQVVSARISSMYGVDLQVVESYVQAAVDLERRTGIAAPIVIAVAIHESSFNSYLFTKSGNPFGIKASQPWDGPTFSKRHDGKDTKFRVYSSVDEAILDFGNFIKSRPWFADALACPMDDYACVIEGLKKSDAQPGYSLNPDWGENVLGVIEKVGLKTLVNR